MMFANKLIPPNLRVKPLPAREVWAIFKRMFALLRDQSTLWTPIIRMVFINIILLCTFIISLFCLAQQQTSLGFTLLGISFLGFIVRSFYFGYLFGTLSAMVLLYLHGNDITMKNAKYLVRTHKLSLGILHVLTGFLTSYFQRNEAKFNKPTLLLRLIFSATSIEALDLFGHFLVPVIVVENVSLSGSLSYLQALRAHLPASLAGLFGVDITKKIIGILLLPIIIGIFALSFLIGVHALMWFPNNTIITLDNFTFSWLPILIGFLLLIFIMSFIRPCMDGLKIIYFTLLYTLIRHPEKIQPTKRTEFTGLLPQH